MKEGPRQQIDKLKGSLDAKKKVLSAAYDAVTDVAEEFDMGAVNAKQADTAIRDIIEGYQAPGAKEDEGDLRNMAYDAAEDVFRKLGFESPEIMQRFSAAMEKRLVHEQHYTALDALDERNEILRATKDALISITRKHHLDADVVEGLARSILDAFHTYAATSRIEPKDNFTTLALHVVEEELKRKGFGNDEVLEDFEEALLDRVPLQDPR